MNTKFKPHKKKATGTGHRDKRTALHKVNGAIIKSHYLSLPSDIMDFNAEKATDKTTGMHKRNKDLDLHLLDIQRRKETDKFNAKLAAQTSTREVPMITFLTCTALKQLEASLGVPLSSMNFADRKELAIPVFGGTYYASMRTLAKSVGHFARKNLNIELAGKKPLLRFLELVRDGTSRKEAVEQMLRDKEAAPPSSNSSTIPLLDFT